MAIPDKRTDEALFCAFRERRDRAALSALFRRRADELLRLAIFLAPRSSDAEDLLQATFLSAIARAETYRPGYRVMSWLCGILTNHARMLRRADRRTAPATRPETSSETPVDAALQAEVASALRAGIAGLKEPYRSVLHLHLQQGLNSSEIGAQLNEKPATVRKQLARALERLRAALPMGIATALVARMSPGQIAERAAEVAQFVGADPAPASFDGPDDLLPADVPLGAGAKTVALVAALAAAGLTMLIQPWSDDRPQRGLEQGLERADARVAAATAAPAAPPAGALARAASEASPAGGPAAARPTLTVTVLDDDGAPLQAVELLAAYDDGRPFRVRAQGAGLLRATSDEDGRAVFTELPLGPLDLGVAGGLPKAKLRVEADSQELTLQLPRRARHSGYVTDRYGAPIRGAEVWISETAGRGDLPALLATTDAFGRYAAASVLRDARVFARHSDHAQSVCRESIPDAELHLELEPAAPPVGVAVLFRGEGAQDAAPVDDALVILAPRSRRAAFYAPTQRRTGPDGRCALPSPGPRPASVLIQAAGYAPTIQELGEGASSLTVELRRPATIRGVARDARGAPLAGRQVLFARSGSRPNEPVSPLLARRAMTNAEGRFRLEGAPRDLLQVRIDNAAPRRAGVPVSAFVVAGVDVDTRSDAQPDVELVASDFTSIQGSIKTPSGAPLAGWHLLAVPSAGPPTYRLLRARTAATDADGRFSLPAVGPDDTYELGVYAPASWWPNPLAAPARFATARAGSPCELVVASADAPRATLRCRALLPSGRPAQQARFQLQHRALHAPVTRPADSRGRASFGDLADGDYWLAVSAAEVGTRTVAVRVEGGHDVDLDAVELTVPARLTVRVLSGVAQPAAWVMAEPLAGGRALRARSRAGSAAEFAPMSPGRYRLQVYGHGVQPTKIEQTLAPGPQLLDLQVARATPVTLTFPFALAHNPFLITGPLAVRVEDEAGEEVFLEHLPAAPAPGRFELALGLRPGTYRVSARSAFGCGAARAVEVTGAAPSAVTLPLELHR